MKSSLFTQFANPHGLLGQMVGWAMAFKNRERTDWAVSLLKVQPADYVLDIGCGPGVAVAQMAQSTPRGLVAGVDISSVMLQQATARNRARVQTGRVTLQQSSVERVPFPAAHFDKALAINSYRFWPAPVANLQEVRRVLKPGGMIAIVEQPMSAEGEASISALKEELHTRLTAAGFHNLQLVTAPMKPATCVAALGRA